MLKKSLLTVAAAMALSAGVAVAETITKPNTFASGTTIKSSEVNANFDTVYDQVNKIDSVINVDSTYNRISVGGNTWNKSGTLTIESDPSTSPSSDHGSSHLSFINPNHTGGSAEDILSIGAITKEQDGTMKIFSYAGGSTADSEAITFNRHGTTGGEVMRVSSDGNVGIGTTAPEEQLHIFSTGNGKGIKFTNAVDVVANIGIGGTTGGEAYKNFAIGTQSNHATGLFTSGGSGRLWLDPSGNVGMGSLGWDQISYPLHMSSGAHVTSGGTWTNASSREYKEAIRPLALSDARAAFEKLEPVTFVYKKEKEERQVGFIAEDVPELVATRDRKGLAPMDIVAVVTRVVQEQQKTIEQQGEEIRALKAMLQQTLAGLAAVQKQVNHLDGARTPPVLNPVSHTESVH